MGFIDVTRFIPLFSKTGNLILQLDNVVTPTLNGQYASMFSMDVRMPAKPDSISAAQLHATFYASSPKHPPAKKSDVIIPLSTLRNDTGVQGSVPPSLTVRFYCICTAKI